MSFRGPCPRCGNLLTEHTRRCPGCGALTSLSPLPRTVPRVRRTPVETLAFDSKPNIECVVLDTAWNYRQVASFASENYSNGRTRATGFALCRAAAATRCDLLNRLD